MSYQPLDQIKFADSAALDAFQRLRTSQAHRVFDSQQEYGLDTLRTWDCTANGTLPTILSPNGSVTSGSNAVGPRDANSRMTPITASTTNGHYSVLQSRQYTRYVPGFSHLVLITGVFASGANSTATFVRRTSTSGSAHDGPYVSGTNGERVDKGSWNIDNFDGSGPSGLTLDLTKTQIMWIGAQWLGVGRVMVGFDIDGRLYPAHQFLHANNLTVPYTQTFNLPVRMEIRNTGAAESKARVGYFDHANGFYLETTRAVAGGTINFVCCSVQSEGADEARGFPQSQNPGVAAITVSTRRPVFSIRPAATFQGITNRGHIEIEDYWLTAATNSSIYEIVIGGTLGGANWLRVGRAEGITAAGANLIVGVRYTVLSAGTSTTGVGSDWANVGAGTGAITPGVSFVATSTGAGVGTGTVTRENSIAEYDISATTITGGGVTYCSEVIAGSGTTRGSAGNLADFRSPLVLSLIDALTATQLPVSIVCTAVTGNSSIRAGMNWHEQVI